MNILIKHRPSEPKPDCDKDHVWTVTVYDKIRSVGTSSDEIAVDYEVVAFDEDGAKRAAKYRYNGFGLTGSDVWDLVLKYEKAVAVLEQIRVLSMDEITYIGVRINKLSGKALKELKDDA